MASDVLRAWVEVDLGALVRNGARLAERAGVPLLPMVKGDAYGLGAAPVARALLALEPWGFGVATLDEGNELRAAGIPGPILVCTPPLEEELPAIREAQLTPTLGTAESIAAWTRAGGGPWHLAVDTGLHRNGVSWNAVGRLESALRDSPPEGAFTHFHSADRNDASVVQQLDRFEQALAALPAQPRIRHVENSPALERLQGRSKWSVVRPGVHLYGVSTYHTPGVRAEPVAALRARIVELLTVEEGEGVSYGVTFHAAGPRRIATVAAGYVDGYRRQFGNVGRAIVNGYRVPVAGTVAMDMTMFDVTGVPCSVGDVVTLFGRSAAGGETEAIDFAAAAREAGISVYEVLTGLHGRLPRVYVSAHHE